jgi:hypothetical protein
MKKSFSKKNVQKKFQTMLYFLMGLCISKRFNGILLAESNEQQKKILKKKQKKNWKKNKIFKQLVQSSCFELERRILAPVFRLGRTKIIESVDLYVLFDKNSDSHFYNRV